MKLPDLGKSIDGQNEGVLLAMCVFGEARGEPPEAQLGVANVVRTRVVDPLRRFGRGWRGVLLRPYAFSCFLPEDPNRAKLLTPLKFESEAVWAHCYETAISVYEGLAADNTCGATHYFDDSIAARPPSWARLYTATVKLGRLNFFRASPEADRTAAGVRNARKNLT
jgi:N-acetylmuramoyl-L-alanine amidase